MHLCSASEEVRGTQNGALGGSRMIAMEVLASRQDDTIEMPRLAGALVVVWGKVEVYGGVHQK